jgi:hypothetical protein
MRKKCREASTSVGLWAIFAGLCHKRNCTAVFSSLLCYNERQIEKGDTQHLMLKCSFFQHSTFSSNVLNVHYCNKKVFSLVHVTDEICSRGLPIFINAKWR